MKLINVIQINPVMKTPSAGLLIAGLLAAALLNGCGSLPTTQRAAQGSTASNKPASNKPITQGQQKQADLYQRLDRHYRNWKGTPYRLGGLSRRGIDCSGFVHLAFRDVLGMNIPRSTDMLADTGTRIAKNQLNVGDLVFFKTGFSKHHVGIYLGKQQFMHASTSRGVMKSSLNNPYWSAHYWKSTRLIGN